MQCRNCLSSLSCSFDLLSIVTTITKMHASQARCVWSKSELARQTCSEPLAGAGNRQMATVRQQHIAEYGMRVDLTSQCLQSSMQIQGRCGGCRWHSDDGVPDHHLHSAGAYRGGAGRGARPALGSLVHPGLHLHLYCSLCLVM